MCIRDRYSTMMEQKAKAKCRTSFPISDNISECPSTILIPSNKAIVKKTTGLNAIPPNRGTDVYKRQASSDS